MAVTCKHCGGAVGADDQLDGVDAGLCVPCQFLALAVRAGLFDLRSAAAKRLRDFPAVAEGRAICCPVCEMTSYHPMDVETGYCGHCHAWTGLPLALRRAREGR